MEPRPPAEDFEKREVVLRADFDLVDDQRCVWVSTRFMVRPRGPRLEEVVYLLDGGGRGCVGAVDRVEGHYVRVRPYWDTFVGQLPSSVAA
jgi:hypothetical protein